MAALNVFGTPITTETLAGMAEYANNDRTTRLDRARVAFHAQNANGKMDLAQQYVDRMKETYGNGASTKCLIYNATGDKLTFVLNHDYHGYVFSGSRYPTEIANGQWGAFLHVHSSGAAVGSSAAVVYHGVNNAGEGRDWCLAWMTPWSDVLYNNYVYAEVREADHYYNANWNAIESTMENGGPGGRARVDRWGGCVLKAQTGSGTTVYCTGIMTLEGAA